MFVTRFTRVWMNTKIISRVLPKGGHPLQGCGLKIDLPNRMGGQDGHRFTGWIETADVARPEMAEVSPASRGCGLEYTIRPSL